MTDNKQPKATLSRIQARALPILLSASSIAAGCRKAGISRDRYYDWMREPEFRTAYEEASNDLVKDSLSNLKLLATDAVSVLQRLLRARSESIRYRTATSIIDSLLKLRDQEEIEQRLSELERTVHDTKDDF